MVEDVDVWRKWRTVVEESVEDLEGVGEAEEKGRGWGVGRFVVE